MREILKGESSRSSEVREFRAGRDRRKEGGRMFSLENVSSRFEAVNGNRRKYFCMYVYVYMNSFVCVCIYQLCRYTKSGKSTFRGTMNHET